MKQTLIVLIVLAVAALFYWQFFAPASVPAQQLAPDIQVEVETAQ